MDNKSEYIFTQTPCYEIVVRAPLVSFIKGLIETILLSGWLFSFLLGDLYFGLNLYTRPLFNSVPTAARSDAQYLNLE